MKKYLYIVGFAALAASVTSCNLDFVPAEAMTSEQIKQEPSGAEYLTTGAYGLFKNTLNQASQTYVRHWFQSSEYRGDNIVVSGRSSDELFNAFTFTDLPTHTKFIQMWSQPYRVIYLANTVIATIPDDTTEKNLHMKGENYFFRALCHLHLVSLYAKQYSQGRDNPGVILRNSADYSVTERATVGEVYDQIVSDLLNAIELLDDTSYRGNHKGYVTKASAQGILSRVYLNMGDNQKVVDLVNQMLAGADPASKLDPNYITYFANALTSVETLWAVAHQERDSRGSSSIASMYNRVSGIGWGEIYPSDPLVKLFMRYPEDIRWTGTVAGTGSTANGEWLGMHQYNTWEGDAASNPAGTMMARFPIPDPGGNPWYIESLNVLEKDAATGKYKFAGGNYAGAVVETKIVNTYPVTYVVIGGQEHEVIVSPLAYNRNSYPRIYNLKFSYQNGNGMLSSPVMVRWGEVILNRAEAYAKLGNTAGALADVNVIRARSGLVGDAQFTEANMTERGYTSVLSVVLDERRMELCWEGHRAFDLIRNNLPINRQYASTADWEIVPPSADKIVYMIPQAEVDAGISQNPK